MEEQEDGEDVSLAAFLAAPSAANPYEIDEGYHTLSDDNDMVASVSQECDNQFSPYDNGGYPERLTYTGLEYTNWAGEFGIDWNGHMYVQRDWKDGSGCLPRCSWVRITAPDQFTKCSGPELTITTPEGESFWLTDIATYSYGNGSWADEDDEDEY